MTATAQDKKWFDEFILELRLRDVPGTAIGDAVAAVEEYCADSGERAEAAFGDARAYAVSLDLPSTPIRRGEMGRLVGFGAMYVTGVFLFLTAGRDALSGESTPVTVSAVVVLAAFLLLFVAAVYRLDWIVRAPMWQPLLAGGALFAAVVAAAVSVHGRVLAIVPAMLLAIIGLALMVVPPIYNYFCGRTLEDPLVDPRGDREPQQRRSRLQNMGISAAVPAGMVLYLVVVWLLDR